MPCNLTLLVGLQLLLFLSFLLGIFLGMSFPLGILTIKERISPSGAIAWAWAMNGLFTVIGGIASVLLSIFFEFNTTLIVALSIYLIAFILFMSLRDTVIQGSA